MDARACIPLPPGVDFKVGAAFMMTYGTSYHALKDRAQLKAGETLLVLGAAGGVGSAAVELGKLMGARVIAAASTDDKLEACKQLGADATINYASEDLREAVKRITEGKGVDVVYDPVGDKFAEPAMRDMAWGGRYLVIGFAGGEIPKNSAQPAAAEGLFHRRRVLGQFHAQGAAEKRGQRARTAGLDRRRQAEAAGQRRLPARAGGTRAQGRDGAQGQGQGGAGRGLEVQHRISAIRPRLAHET